jgi:hypothetical protein
MPIDGGYDQIKRYANVMVIAEMLRAEEDADERVLGTPVPRKTPAEQWALAERVYDESRAERELSERRDAEAATRAAENPQLTVAEERFNAAKEACRTGHEAGCTYGGMSAPHGYWLAVEECARNHGDDCDLHVACDGAEAATGFAGREWAADDWIWSVAACQPCADLYVTLRPEYARRTPEQEAEQQREAEAFLAEMHASAAPAEHDETRPNEAEHDRLSPNIAEQVWSAAKATGHAAEPRHSLSLTARDWFGEPVSLIPVATSVRGESRRRRP